MKQYGKLVCLIVLIVVTAAWIPNPSMQMGFRPQRINLAVTVPVCEGTVQSGEWLTTAIERSCGRLPAFSNFSLVVVSADGREVSFFKDKNAFNYEGIVSLPATWPGDTFFLDTRQNAEKIYKERNLGSRPTIFLESRFQEGANNTVVRYLTVFGSTQYNQPVFNQLVQTFSDSGEWKVLLNDNSTWVPSSELKELMDAGVSSSVALATLTAMK